MIKTFIRHAESKASDEGFFYAGGSRFFCYLGKYANLSFVDTYVDKKRGAVHMSNGFKDSIFAVDGVGILAYDMNKYEQQWDIRNEAFSMPNLVDL